MFLRSHGGSCHALSLSPGQERPRTTLGTAVLPWKPLWVAINFVKELVERSLLRVATATFRQACADPGQVNFATMQLHVDFSQRQCLGLLPWTQMPRYRREPQVLEELLLLGHGEGVGICVSTARHKNEA